MIKETTTLNYVNKLTRLSFDHIFIQQEKKINKNKTQKLLYTFLLMFSKENQFHISLLFFFFNFNLIHLTC